LSSFLQKLSEKNLILSLFFISLSVRIFYGIYYYSLHGTSNFVDDWVYIDFAKAMIEQGIFVNDISGMTPTRSGVTPFYPLLIYSSFKLFGYNFIPVILMNAVYSSLLTVVIYAMGKIMFGKTIAILSSVWTLFYVNSIRWVPTLLKENLIHFLFALFVLLIIVYFIKEKNYLYLFLISFVFSLLIHTDERYIVYFLIILTVIFFRNNLSLKHKIFSVIFISLLTILFMTPWLIRNYEVYKRPVLLSERTSPLIDKYLGYKNPNNFSQEIQISDATLDSILKGIPVCDMTVYNLIQRGMSYGTLPVRHSKPEKAYIDFKELWRPFRFSNMWVSEGFRPEGKWSLSHNISVILTYGILLPFFIIGMFLFLKEKNVLAIVLFLIVAIHTLLHITIVLSQNRYRFPIDIIIIVLAFYGLINLVNIFKSKKLLDAG